MPQQVTARPRQIGSYLVLAAVPDRWQRPFSGGFRDTRAVTGWLRRRAGL